MNGIVLEQAQKTLIIGDFQTGKTTLAHVLLTQFPRWLAFDPTWALPDGRHTVGEALADFHQTGHGVFQPQPQDLEGQFDSFCWAAMQLDNLVAYIDEPALVLNSAGTIPLGFSSLYRLGHKRGVGVILSTHRLTGDLPALTRIFHHLFAFRITIDNDQRALAGYIGADAAEYVATQPDYYFFYRGQGNVRQAYAPLPLEGYKEPAESIDVETPP